MLKFTKQTINGLNAVLFLSRNNNLSKPVRSREMSEKLDVQFDFLYQILHVLKKAGIVKTVRGKEGGYILAKKPCDIFLIDVLKAFGDNLTLRDGKIRSIGILNFIADVEDYYLQKSCVSFQSIIELDSIASSIEIGVNNIIEEAFAKRMGGESLRCETCSQDEFNGGCDK